MKKTIITSIVALFAVTTLFAQSSNSYNMQIELKNGTKVVLGPNDLSSISFNGDALKIEGNTIDELLKKIDMTQAQIATIEHVIAKNQTEIEELKQNLGGGESSADEDKKIAELQDQITALNALIKNLQAQQENQLMQVKQLEAKMAAAEDGLLSQQKEYLTLIKDLNSNITNNAAQIAALNSAVAALKQSSQGGNAEVEAQINNLEAMIKTLQADQTASVAQLANLKNELGAVNANLADMSTFMNAFAKKDELAALQTMMTAQTADLQKVQETGEKNVAELKAKTDEMVKSMQALQDNQLMLVKQLEDKMAVAEEWLAKVQTMEKNDVAELHAKTDAIYKAVKTKTDDLEKEVVGNRAMTEEAKVYAESLSDKMNANYAELRELIEAIYTELRLFEEFVQVNMPFNESFEQWKEKQQ